MRDPRKEIEIDGLRALCQNDEWKNGSLGILKALPSSNFETLKHEAFDATLSRGTRVLPAPSMLLPVWSGVTVSLPMRGTEEMSGRDDRMMGA